VVPAEHVRDRQRGRRRGRGLAAERVRRGRAGQAHAG
jgi:hypothetical protein